MWRVAEKRSRAVRAPSPAQQEVAGDSADPGEWTAGDELPNLVSSFWYLLVACGACVYRTAAGGVPAARRKGSCRHSFICFDPWQRGLLDSLGPREDESEGTAF